MAKLFEQFPSITKADWLSKVEKDLKGRPLDSLNWAITENIVMTPFAHAEDLEKSPAPLINKRATNSWEIGVRIVVKDMQLANKEALNALMNGANALAFELTNSLNKSDLSILLKGIELEWISTHFIFKESAWKPFLNLFIEYLDEQKCNKEKLACTFSFGSSITSSQGATYFTKVVRQLPQVQLLTIDTKALNQGTDTVIQELTETIIQGNQALINLNKQNLELAQYHTQIQFSLSLRDSYFVNIAKIRALKLLWQQVLSAWQIESSTCNIEVHLTTTTQTDNENYNKIKATAQAMAAVIGGAKRLYIYPSDEFKDGIGSPFAQRIALNIQHLMQLESYMDRVVDPAAGSYYIEKLTNQLAEEAWRVFVVTGNW